MQHSMRSCFPSTINNIIYFLLITITTFHFQFHRDMIGYAIPLPKGVKVPAVIAFGDSIVDTGNNNFIHTIARCNFPPYGQDFGGGNKPTGRFSNGKVPSDIVAEELGLKELIPPYLDPNITQEDLLTGVCFASGAAGYDPVTSKYPLVMPLSRQMELFKNYTMRLRAYVGDNKTEEILSQSVFFIASGSNDIANTFYFTRLGKIRYHNISAYTDFMVTSASTFFQELYDQGARRFGILGAPPIGCLPSQRTFAGGKERKCVEEYNQAAILFNSKLQTELDNLNKNHSDAKFVYLDSYNPLLHIIQNPSESGFSVVDKGCCGTGKIEATFLCNRFSKACANRTEYIFWDSFHPTEAAYRYLVSDILKNSINKFF